MLKIKENSPMLSRLISQKPVDWIGLHPKEIRDLAHLLSEKADQIDEARKPKRD
jgi:hypothetical protein